MRHGSRLGGRALPLDEPIFQSGCLFVFRFSQRGERIAASAPHVRRETRKRTSRRVADASHLLGIVREITVQCLLLIIPRSVMATLATRQLSFERCLPMRLETQIAQEVAHGLFGDVQLWLAEQAATQVVLRRRWSDGDQRTVGSDGGRHRLRRMRMRVHGRAGGRKHCRRPAELRRR